MRMEYTHQRKENADDVKNESYLLNKQTTVIIMSLLSKYIKESKTLYNTSGVDVIWDHEGALLEENADLSKNWGWFGDGMDAWKLGVKVGSEKKKCRLNRNGSESWEGMWEQWEWKLKYNGSENVKKDVLKEREIQIWEGNS